MSASISSSIAPSEELVTAELARVLGSPQLKGSEPLRNLLNYLAQHSRDGGGAPAREHDIALAVFGRRDFDAKIDSVVRVQTARLRSKLAEYYMAEGSQSEIILEIPKGSYGVSAHFRLRAAAPSTSALTVAKPLPSKSAWIAAACLVVAVLVVTAIMLLPKRATALETFWKPFCRNSDDAMVIFANPRLVGQSITGLKLYDPSQPEPAWINETYSGVGEVFGIYELTRTLSLWRKPISLRRAGQMNWEEAKHRDLIFLGAPNHNSPAGELRLRHFAFRSSTGITAIANLRPRAGEPSEFRGSGPPYTSDVALIAELPSFDSSRRALILAGTTTFGTQAAAEFVAREHSVTELLARLGVPRGGDIPPFEAVLQVRITGGAAVESSVAAFRTGN